MKFFSIIVQSALLLTTPALMAYPTEQIPTLVSHKKHKKDKIHIPDLSTLSYDQVLALLEKIESESFRKKVSKEDLDKINQFITFLALEGSTEQEKPAMQMAVADLFRETDLEYASSLDVEAFAVPAIFLDGTGEVIQCKNWFKKKAKATKDFVKKHKKAIIIGAIIVVTVVVVVVAAAAISASAASAAALAGSGTLASSAGSGSESTPQNGTSSLNSEEPLFFAVKEEVSAFKETVAQEQFAAISDSDGISMEENGRIIGSLFAHKTVESLKTRAAENPSFATELNDLGFNSPSPTPQWLQSYAGTPTTAPHYSTDFAFSTDYTTSYGGDFGDLNAMSYQARGELALSSGCYTQATQDFSKAIEIDPSNPIPYLGRGTANFELGQYDNCVADFNCYVAQEPQRASDFSWADFSVGFVKELPHGAYESGKGLVLFVSDLALHPVQTSKQVYESLAMLSNLAKSGEWGTIGESLSPEAHRLITQWDALSATEKGELAGYVFGKHGADLLIPGAATKIAQGGAIAAKDLAVICKNLQNAEKVLVLEAVAGGSAAGIKISEVVTVAERTIAAGEDLGLTAKEIGALKDAGELKQVVGKGRDFFEGRPDLQAYFDLHKDAKEILKPYIKKSMPEGEIRDLIHKAKIGTFPKPEGIPDSYLVRITEKGAGMEYFHPTKKDTSVRVMPGKPHSSNACQQKPYVIHTENGKARDKNGTIVGENDPAAHIPLEEFVYRD